MCACIVYIYGVSKKQKPDCIYAKESFFPDELDEWMRECEWMRVIKIIRNNISKAYHKFVCRLTKEISGEMAIFNHHQVIASYLNALTIECVWARQKEKMDS